MSYFVCAFWKYIFLIAIFYLIFWQAVLALFACLAIAFAAEAEKKDDLEAAAGHYYGGYGLGIHRGFYGGFGYPGFYRGYGHYGGFYPRFGHGFYG